MSVPEVLIPLGVYVLPLLLFFFMGLDVLLRNPGKTEHRLVSLTIGCYFLLFLEEYIRHLLPLAYSPLLAAYWFAPVGIAIPGLGFHFLIKYTGMDKRLPRRIYPWIFYLPLIMIPVTWIAGKSYIASQVFYQEGVWKQPLYNTAYYAALCTSLLISTLSLIFLIAVSRRRPELAARPNFRMLVLSTKVTLAWAALFGFLHPHTLLPPYPYLYAGLIYCFFLRLAMVKHDFLDDQARQYEQLFALNPAAALVLDDTARIRRANPCAQELFSRISLEQAPFERIADRHLLTLIQAKEPLKGLETMLMNGDESIAALIDGDYFMYDNEPHVLLIIRDITREKEREKQITFLAYHDSLTNLPNRRYFYQELPIALKRAQAAAQPLLVIIIDLDDFKEINDTRGHQVGDAVLCHMSRLLEQWIAPGDMAARLGGDEFVLFLQSPTQALAPRRVMEELAAYLADAQLEQGTVPLRIRASIGASLFPFDGEDADTLISSADRNMYQMKHSRKANQNAW